ncbi:MAG: hypothetical protein RI985_947 [Chloroflexota bacterium]|jgi:hypothetical protein
MKKAGRYGAYTDHFTPAESPVGVGCVRGDGDAPRDTTQFSVGLIAVLVWVTWPMLPDWRFDGVGVWRGRTCVAAWSDVQSVDVRSYAHAARQLGSIDVVMRTPTQVIRLRLYCRVEAQQVMRMLDQYVPAGCDRKPIVEAVVRAWPKYRPD